MQSSDNVKFYHLLLQHRHHHGFSIIEFFVVIIIFGILAVIALPSLIYYPPESKASEAGTYVRAMNRGQEVYFMKSQDGKFSNSISKLGIGIQEETKRYRYYTKALPNTAFSYGIAKRKYSEDDWLNKRPIKSFVGAVFVIPTTQKEESIKSIVCKNDQPGNIIPSQPILKNDVPNCALGTTPYSDI
jgi:prepilin-type N-terminal cleavage/methylation domain-containing protein